MYLYILPSVRGVNLLNAIVNYISAVKWKITQDVAKAKYIIGYEASGDWPEDCPANKKIALVHPERWSGDFTLAAIVISPLTIDMLNLDMNSEFVTLGDFLESVSAE